MLNADEWILYFQCLDASKKGVHILHRLFANTPKVMC